MLNTALNVLGSLESINQAIYVLLIVGPPAKSSYGHCATDGIHEVAIKRCLGFNTEKANLAGSLKIEFLQEINGSSKDRDGDPEVL